MSQVTVKYFASMRDRMGREEEQVNLENDSTTIADLWGQLSNGQPIPESTLISVNMEYTDPGHVLKPGDEIGFFPPVTGG